VYVSICDPTGREVDAVAAQQPLAGGRVHSELPDERVTVHACGAEVRLVSLEVVHDTVARLGLDAAAVLRQDERQWKN
jgi:hypothetical protein